MGAAAIPLIVAGVSAVGKGVSSYNEGNSEYAASEANRKINNKNAVDSLLSSIRASESTTSQINKQATNVSIEAQKAAAQARGTAEANAGASGTGGGAVDMQIDDVNNTAARNLAVSTINKRNNLESIESDINSSVDLFSNRLNLMEAQEPSVMDSILGGGMTGASTYFGMSGGG